MADPKVLIVDDARFMRMMLVNLLSKSGFEVAGEAADGREAVTKYIETRPDVVSLDIMMPNTDGLAALKQILAHDPEARVVIVSAMGHASMVKDALDLGAVEYIVKPFSPQRIVDVLKRAARRKVLAEDKSGE
ncbi:MAG: response regulator [Armatimonadetes bacterium]|nr:response regulator [Armatimonadota bacterium]